MTERPVIVFLGPSMPLCEARRTLDAEYRAPIKRGDLKDIEPGAIVAIIDGVFEQERSVSPREVLEAVERGVVVFGGSSMGALRAAEVPGVIGVGRVYQWYRDGVIIRDDEVALLFDPQSRRALTVPTVNVRFAVERLRSLGTIDAETAGRLISAAEGIHYAERTYGAILAVAGLDGRADSQDLVAMLQAQDIKYNDALAVLEAIDRYLLSNGTWTAPVRARVSPPEQSAEAADAALHEILVWESGDRASREALIEFLAVTGKLECFAGAIVRRSALETGWGDLSGLSVSGDVQPRFVSAARRWGWVSAQEATVTLADLSLDQDALAAACGYAQLADELALYLLRKRDEAAQTAILCELFLHDLALKREVMRLGALQYFAGLDDAPASPDDMRDAQTVLAKANQEYHFQAVRDRWRRLGIAERAAQDAIVEQVARARRSARPLALAMKGLGTAPGPSAAVDLSVFGLGRRPKPPGEARFCLPVAEAEEHARRIADVIGVTRIGMIGELGDLGGMQVAQAARPGNAWSSSYGSGKSRSKAGAIVGSVMEETEKWAQEHFQADAGGLVDGSYRELRDHGPFIDPATLDLPYDTAYRETQPLRWYSCMNLLSGGEVFVPVDLLQIGRAKHDIYYTQRGARKHLATNGLGCGFSREEAVLHGLCEYVERHAQRLAELFLANPGGLGAHPYRFVDLATCSGTIQDLAAGLRRNNAIVRVLDITSDVAIPTFVATIVRELRKADGYGSHPDPETAIEMALLEAGQTIASAVAGGREDLTIHARSLGRHERPRPVSMDDAWFWLDPDAVGISVGKITGLSSGDVYEDLIWCLDRLHGAGLEHVIAVDLTPPGIEPACVVRVVIPGLETNNPFFTGPRARLVLLRDLLPRWQ